MKKETKKINAYTLRVATINALRREAERLGEKRGTYLSASSLVDELVHKHIILKMKGPKI